MIPLYVVLFFGLLPPQLWTYLKVILIIIAILLFFKGFKLNNKQTYYFLFTSYVAVFIFSFLIFKTFNVKNSPTYFSNEWVYYPVEFNWKVWLDLNYDGFVDLWYNVKDKTFEDASYVWIWLLLWIFFVLALVKAYKNWALLLLMLIFPLFKVWWIEYIVPDSYKNSASEDALDAANSVIQEMKEWEESDEWWEDEDDSWYEEDEENTKNQTSKVENETDAKPSKKENTNQIVKESKNKTVSKQENLWEMILNSENTQKLLELVWKKLDKLEKASQLRQELKKQAKNIRENTDKLVKDVLEENDDILDKTKTIKWMKTLVDVTNKLFSAYSIYQDSKSIKTKAKLLGVEISTWVAQVASFTQNSLWNLLEDNPYDAVVGWVWDVFQTAWEILNVDFLKKTGDFVKDKLTFWWNFKETINLAVTTSDETFENMKQEYDKLYEEETKNAGAFKKAYKYLEYKVVGKSYYYVVKWTSSVIKITWKVWDKIKSWF